ncbi:chordin-like [Elysia marginata]|uniref:Chordin-like n=1 Tax=Elysia marginata TaxID=1093978 RepID=A0AAV4GJY6_9GAST|nr:chordin-like [Elysia marginata]
MLSIESKLWLVILWTLVVHFLIYSSASPYFTLVSSALKNNRNSVEDLPGCYLGGQHYKFFDRWSPVMEPTGLMVCLKCECLQIERKGMVQTKGETVCRNIKHRCPDVTCSNPRTLPGRCCKICRPEDDFEATLTFRNERMPLYPPEHLPSDDTQVYSGNNVYTSLLTGFFRGRSALSRGSQTSSGGTSSGQTVAALRMTMAREQGQLDFTLRLSARLDQSSFLQLVDEHGDVQLQKSLDASVDKNKKICGTWNEVPSVYKSYLDNGQLMARITSPEFPGGVIAGEITSDPESQEELMSGLLYPIKPDGSGGKVKVTYTPRTRTAIFTVTTRGLHFDAGTKQVYRLSVVYKSRTIFRSSDLVLSKVNQLKGNWRLKRKRHSRLLARGKLRMRVLTSGAKREVLLEGALLSRLSCNVFQAVSIKPDMTQMSKPESPVVSSVVVTIGDKGWLAYRVLVAGAPHNSVKRIILESSRSNHRRHVLWKKSSQPETISLQSSNTRNEFISGRYSNLDMETLYRLLKNRLYVMVMLKKRAKLKAALVSTQENSFGTERKTVWLTLPPSLDSQGKAEKIITQLQLSMTPDCSLRFTAFVVTPKVEGDFTDLPGISLLALDRGYAYLQLTRRDLDTDLPAAYTQKVQTRVPNICWRHPGGNLNLDTSSTTALHQQQQQQLGDEGSFEVQKDPTATQEMLGGDQEPPPTCRFEGQVYPEGSAWLPDVNARCTTCSCVKSEVMCQRMICPKLFCSNPVTVDGECCPSCPVEPSVETCQLGQDPRTYRLHSSWHPYLPLEGFTRCAICTCLPGGHAVCTKTECPPLTCDRSQWVKSKNDSCCYTCAPEVNTLPPGQLIQGDIDMRGACFDRGQLRRNGETWHPTIQTFGFMKCIQCLCTNGSFKCDFLKCPKLTCTRKKKIPNVCCEVCEDGSPNTGKQLPKPKKISVKRKTRRRKTKRKKKRRACRVDNRLYIHGEKWRPPTEHSRDNCEVCRCKNGKAACRMRCPRTCDADRNSHRCCKYCGGKSKKERAATERKERLPRKKMNDAGKVSSVFAEKIDLIKFLH